MELKPVGAYGRPRYPSRDEAHADPRLLHALPTRWRAQPAVLTALGAACSILEACAQQPKLNGAAGKQTCVVAPLFVHGEGLGAFGCRAVNPPVFLSEDEARDAIKDELTKAGLTVRDATDGAAGVDMPVRTHWRPAPKGSVRPKSEHVQWRVVDGRVPVHVRFVSGVDARTWSDPPEGSAYMVDPRGAARRLMKVVQTAKPTGVFAAFYDPFAKASKSDAAVHGWNVRRSSRRDASVGELRAQVHDFIAWLKTQGVV